MLYTFFLIITFSIIIKLTMLASNLFIFSLSSSLLVILTSAGSLPSNQQQLTSIQSNRQQTSALSQLSQANPFHHNLSPLSQQQQSTLITTHQTNSLNNPYTLATHSLLLDLRQQLINRALKFDEHFRSLLSSSKLNLHNMFVDTYGMMYEHNTEIFTSMYESLEQYYATGQIKLTKSMENFFERLYQKIFQVYNSNRAFTPSYLECATEQLAHLKPFKDAPEKLIGEIRHAFVAARTFNQALNSGIDAIKSIISVSFFQFYSCKPMTPYRIIVGHLSVVSIYFFRGPTCHIGHVCLECQTPNLFGHSVPVLTKLKRIWSIFS